MNGKDEKEEWISFRLDPDADADLIAWRDSQARGQRSELCKRALRLLITGEAIMEPNAEAFDRLRQTVEALARKIERGVIVQANDAPGKTVIDEAQAAKRAKQILERKW